ncbi:hypothetical protein ACEPAH_2567 [Sanghuangporus vaninii]
MGKFNPPSAYEPRTDDVRQRDNAGESSPPVRERSKDFRAANRMRSCQSAKEVVSAGYSDPAERTRSRRATVSFVLPENHRSDVESPGRSRPSSTPPTSRTTAPPGPPRRSPRPSSILLRGRNLQRAIQDRYPSILECLNNHLGDAQASPFHKQDATDVSPIVVAARHVREYGRSARAEALQTVGMLLKRIDQQKVSKVEIRNVFFILCIDMFARVSINLSNPSSDRQLCTQDPLDNIAEVSLAFQLFRVLVQEEILQGSDFIRAAITLCEEGHYDGCKLFTQLAVDDKKTDLAESEVEILADIVSNLKLDQNKGKKNVT